MMIITKRDMIVITTLGVRREVFLQEVEGEPTSSRRPLGEQCDAAVTAASLDMAEDLAKTMLYAVIATLLIAPLALGDRGGYSALMGSRPVVWLGEISYEIFLLHVVVIEIVMVSVLGWPIYTGSVLGLFLITVALTVPLAWVLHRMTRPRAR